MIAYKGFNKDLKSVLGNGKEECCTFEIGKTMTEENCKTARNGFHCCENPFECLSYYPMNGLNRFFKVEAAGNIDEDENERISCTELRLIEELDTLRFAYEGMKYIIKHPQREKWQQNYSNVKVMSEQAEAALKGDIAIARGEDPMVRGAAGSFLGLIKEKHGTIVAARLFVPVINDEQKWIRLGENGELEEATNEEEAG